MRRSIVTPMISATCGILIVLGTLAARAEEEFVTLFNGRDLSGWFQSSGGRWVVEEGVIALQREGDGREYNHTYLWTEESYGDFVLELEFRVPERANSGIFLRTADIDDPVYTGLEVQITNSYGRRELTRGGTAGAIYDCLAPASNPIRPPGQWNHCRITCRDNIVTVELNGEQVINMDLDQWTESGKNPDGSENKFTMPLKDFARAGRIGLQDHGLPVWYRNIRVKRL